MLKNFIYFFKKLIKFVIKNKSKLNIKRRLHVLLKKKIKQKNKTKNIKIKLKYQLYLFYMNINRNIYKLNRYKYITSFLKSNKIPIWKYLGNINFLYWLDNKIYKLKKRRFFFKSKRKKIKEKYNYIYIKRRKWIYFYRKRKYISINNNLFKKKQISLKKFFTKSIKNKKYLKKVLKTIVYSKKINNLNLTYVIRKFFNIKNLYKNKLIFIKNIIKNLIYTIIFNIYYYYYNYLKLKYWNFFIKINLIIKITNLLQFKLNFIILFYYIKKSLILYNLKKNIYFYYKKLNNYKIKNKIIIKIFFKYNNKYKNTINNNSLYNLKKNKNFLYTIFNIFFDWKNMFFIKLKFFELLQYSYSIYLKNLMKIPVYEYSWESSKIIPKNIINEFLPKIYNFYIWRYYNIKKINEFLIIIILTAFLKISKFFCIYIRNILKKILLKYHKNFFLFFFSIIKNFIWQYRKYFGIKGIVLEFRGKLAKGGNTRKKLMCCKYGEYSYSNKHLKMTYDKWDTWSSTGAIGCFFKLFFFNVVNFITIIHIFIFNNFNKFFNNFFKNFKLSNYFTIFFKLYDVIHFKIL